MYCELRNIYLVYEQNVCKDVNMLCWHTHQLLVNVGVTFLTLTAYTKTTVSRAIFLQEFIKIINHLSTTDTASSQQLKC